MPGLSYAEHYSAQPTQMRQYPRIRQRLPFHIADAQYVGAHALVIVRRRTCAQAWPLSTLSLP